MDQVIRYARNPEKTTEASGKKLHEIEGIVDYAADELKTERCTYVTGINLDSVETAAAEFMEVKQMEGKLGGRVCYHGYQSFREDEVDADTAHKIGVALASELWGDRFQVVVATHCNTNHYHNHFVLNSVSDVDGLMFILPMSIKRNHYERTTLYEPEYKESISYTCTNPSSCYSPCRGCNGRTAEKSLEKW